MILINLLPHRAAARARRRERFILSMALSVVAGALVGGVLHLGQVVDLSAQRARNDTLRVEIQRVDTQIKDITDLRQQIATLRARQKAVEDLQADRNLPVHLLQELVHQLPDGIYLTSLRQEGYLLTLQGAAQSSERVSELLRHLGHRSAWLAGPELVEIVSGQVSLSPREQRRVANFQLRVRLLRAAEAAAPPQATARP